MSTSGTCSPTLAAGARLASPAAAGSRYPGLHISLPPKLHWLRHRARRGGRRACAGACLSKVHRRLPPSGNRERLRRRRPPPHPRRPYSIPPTPSRLRLQPRAAQQPPTRPSWGGASPRRLSGRWHGHSSAAGALQRVHHGACIAAGAPGRSYGHRWRGRGAGHGPHQTRAAPRGGKPPARSSTRAGDASRGCGPWGARSPPRPAFSHPTQRVTAVAVARFMTPSARRRQGRHTPLPPPPLPTAPT